MHNNLPFKKIADYRSYVMRLQRYGDMHHKNIAIANQAIAGGYMQPCAALDGHAKTISGLIVEDPRKSRFYEPFGKPKPSMVDQLAFDAVAKEAAETIKTLINPLLKAQLNWYQTQYKPKCAIEPGISAQPDGDQYYAFRVRQMTTTTKSADEIHNIGLSEVARIRAEMVTVAKEAGYDDQEAFIEHLRTDPKYYAKTPEELMEKVARVAKIIDGKMPSVIGKQARLPYGIKEIPKETAGRYNHSIL